jgi:hypothetical protein
LFLNFKILFYKNSQLTLIPKLACKKRNAVIGNNFIFFKLDNKVQIFDQFLLLIIYLFISISLKLEYLFEIFISPNSIKSIIIQKGRYVLEI